MRADHAAPLGSREANLWVGTGGSPRLAYSWACTPLLQGQEADAMAVAAKLTPHQWPPTPAPASPRLYPTVQIAVF